MKIVCAALLAALVFLFFSPVLSFDFVNWDDDVYVYDNPSIRGFEPANLRRWFTRPQVRLYVPATMMSYAADYALHGNRAGGFHATNLALHLANSLLAFWILFSVSGNAWASFLGALLFALHPAQIEPVAWISERKSLLSAFFSLGAFVLFMRPPGRAGLERALSPALLAVLCLLA
ncbi:MAG: hypothetical protein HY714_00545, partial [Candidatus Omnitrophica bacterium]|nr:hypothetical protein [Candidatus Omnitrophota bacterium]